MLHLSRNMAICIYLTIFTLNPFTLRGFFYHHSFHRSFSKCYDLALLPSIICLGRLRIASKYIFNLRQLRLRVDNLAQWLEHWILIREDRVRFLRQAENFFQLCYDFHVVRWGLVRDRTLFCQKWLRVIINDDFLEKGECDDLALLLLIICRQISHNYKLCEICQGKLSKAGMLHVGLSYCLFRKVVFLPGALHRRS